MSVTEPVYIAAAATDAAIRTAALAASTNGGGIVKIPAGTITLTSSLVCYNGVIYMGVPVRASYAGGLTAGDGGTILTGDGTFPAFGYNTTDVGTAPTNYPAWYAAMLNGFGLSNLTLVNFSYGVKIGAIYSPGMHNCFFENLYIINCQQWGFWVENYIECNFDRVTANNCQAGGIARICSDGGLLNHGNSRWYATFVQTAGLTTARGLCMWARNSSFLNDESTYGEQCNRVILNVPQAATMTNASANITVTDGSQFPVGTPVTFSASVNGFVNKQIYFVATRASNVITLTDKQGIGTAIAATGNTAVNIISNGYPALEVGGLDTNSYVTGPSFVATDLEAGGTCLALFQNVRALTFFPGYIDPQTASVPPEHYRTFCLRNVMSGSITSWNVWSVDADSTSQDVLMTGPRWDYPNVWTGSPTGTLSFGKQFSTVIDAVTNNTSVVSDMRHHTTGTVANGFGLTEARYLQNTAGTSTLATLWNWNWSDATVGAEYTQGSLAKKTNGAMQDVLNFTWDGSVSLKPYQVQTNSATLVETNLPAYLENTSTATYTLPALAFNAAGKSATFYVANASGITINAPAARVIQIAAAVTASGGNITCATVGSAIRLIGRQNGNWYAEAVVGTWVTH